MRSVSVALLTVIALFATASSDTSTQMDDASQDLQSAHIEDSPNIRKGRPFQGMGKENMAVENVDIEDHSITTGHRIPWDHVPIAVEGSEGQDKDAPVAAADSVDLAVDSSNEAPTVGVVTDGVYGNKVHLVESINTTSQPLIWQVIENNQQLASMKAYMDQCIYPTLLGTNSSMNYTVSAN